MGMIHGGLRRCWPRARLAVAATALLLSVDRPPLNAQAQQPQEARRLQQQAAELRAKGNHQDALPLLRQAVTLLEQEFGPDAGVVGDAINLVGTALFQTGKYPEASAEFDRALSIRRKAVAQTLNNLANAARGQG